MQEKSSEEIKKVPMTCWDLSEDELVTFIPDSIAKILDENVNK